MAANTERIALQLRILVSTKRFPTRLEDVVDRILAVRKRYSRDEILGAVDYLANRRLLELRTPNNTVSRTLFTKVTDLVPQKHHEIVRVLLQLHGMANQ